MTTFAGVRAARPGDENDILQLALMLHKENGMMKLDSEKVMGIIKRATSGEDGYIIGVIDGPEGLEGAVCLVIAAMYYTAENHLEELWNFVHPAHRRTTHAKRLIEWSKWCADQLSVPLLIGIVTRDRLVPKMRLYQRQLPQIGALFLHGKVPSDQFNQRNIDPL